MDLKSFLKLVKLNEGNIIIVLGVLVIFVASIATVSYFRNIPNEPQGQIGTAVSDEVDISNDIKVTSEGFVSNSERKNHTVIEGESLWSIAEKDYENGEKWQEIANENSLVYPYTIRPGQELVLPDVQKSSSISSLGEKHENSDQISGSNYIVRSGDNLWNIAKRAYGNGDNWIMIAHENNLANPRLIHSGNTLVIPR